MTDLYQHARDVAVAAANEAGAYIRSAVGTVRPDIVRIKGIHDLVTHVDEESERLIVDRLQSAFPEHDILAEEDDGVHRQSNAEFRWIIDPLDGTTNFTRGVPPYAVSIALQHRDRLIIGVVLDIPTDELYTAVDGQGAFMNDAPIRVSATPSLSEGLITTGFPYRAFGHVDVYLHVLKHFMETTRGVRRPGSAAVDLAWVASGRFDGFFETGLMPWDVAAGMVLVREAGGRISDYRGETNPRLGAQIVATNGFVHEEMMHVLSPMKDVYD